MLLTHVINSLLNFLFKRSLWDAAKATVCQHSATNHPTKVIAVLTIPPWTNGRYFADDIFRCIFMNEAFSFWLKCHWNLFLRVKLTITIGLDNGLAPNRRQAIIWTNADPIPWRIYATLRGDDLTHQLQIYRDVVDHPMLPRRFIYLMNNVISLLCEGHVHHMTLL